jgi:chaperonin GroES
MATASKVKVQPLADRVVVEPLEETEEMRGGLYIPDTAKEKPQQGTVIAVGPGRVSDEGERLPVELEEGQRILYGKYSGTEVNIDGHDLLIIKSWRSSTDGRPPIADHSPRHPRTN